MTYHGHMVTVVITAAVVVAAVVTVIRGRKR